MHGVHLGGVIAPAMMAFGKQSDRGKMSKGQSLAKVLFGKFAAHTWHMFRGMKVKVYLTERDLIHVRASYKFSLIKQSISVSVRFVKKKGVQFGKRDVRIEPVKI